MAKTGEATLLLRIKEIGGEILDRFVITLGDVTDMARKVADAIMKSIDAFREQQEAVNQLNQSMINQGTFSAELQNKYLDLAGALQKVTAFSDDQIISAQGILQAHVGNREVTEALVMATLNLATAKKMDLASAAELIGKTISTENNVLARQGVHLDEATLKTDRMAAVIQGIQKDFDDYAEASAKGLGATKRLANAFSELLEVMGEAAAPVVTGFSNAVADVFFKFSEMASKGSLAKKSTSELNDQLIKLTTELEKVKNYPVNKIFGFTINDNSQQINFLQSQIDQVKALRDKQVQDEQASLENALDAQKETKITKNQETWMALQEQKIAQDEMDIALLGASEEQKLQAEIQHLNKRLSAATDFAQKKQLMIQKHNLLEQLEDEKSKRLEKERDEKASKEKEANQRSTFATIATLSRSNNSTLAAIGKAAAITQIAIDTPVAIGRALSAFPPPFNFAAAGLVGAAMAAQAAQIAGVQLADGGIVRATQGGVPAIIGEGGRDEAVIPLENGGVPGMGTTINITVNGGLLGDRNSARELAVAIDKELYDLRKQGGSVSFDGIS